MGRLSLQDADLRVLGAGALHLQIPPSVPCSLLPRTPIDLKITFPLVLLTVPFLIWVAIIED